MIHTVKQGLEAEGVKIPITRLCRCFEVPRRTLYYKPTKSAPTVQPAYCIAGGNPGRVIRRRFEQEIIDLLLELSLWDLPLEKIRILIPWLTHEPDIGSLRKLVAECRAG